MSPSAFLDRSAPPPPDAVAAILGTAEPVWQALRSSLAAEFPSVEEAWVYGGKTHGWSLRLRLGSRAIAYLTPVEGEVQAGLALGEKAVRAALAAGLTGSAVALVETAPRYAEGRGVRLAVRSPADVETVLLLARAKMST